MAQLRHAAANPQQLVGELVASLWEKVTEQERRFPERHLPATTTEPALVVAVANRLNTHYTLVYMNNLKCIFDVEGYIPKETIVDTRAAKVTLSKPFAVAKEVNTHSLSRGVE